MLSYSSSGRSLLSLARTEERDNPDIDVQPCCWRSIHSLLQHGHRCVSAQAARVDIQNWSSPKNLFHCRMMEVSP